MTPIKTRFSIQNHFQQRTKSSHFDLRILNPKRTTLWSFAFPKSRFPNLGEKILAIRTPNHPVGYMYFQGMLDNKDKVQIYDKGLCIIILYSQNLLVLYFNGNKIKGTFNFIRLVKSENSWLVMQSKQKLVK